jgi:YHS domain-containing protein
MLRLVILALSGYLGYKMLQKVLPWLQRRQVPPPRRQEEVAAEELVQDPICKIFIPRRNALIARRDGQDYFFCSEGCRKKFLQQS